jgi:hypothetical protein
MMGKKDIVWQNTAYVLALFGKTVNDARKGYADYVSKCARAGRRPELTGGGLIRSAVGWRAIREAYEAGMRLTGDERILGNSSFVEKALASVGEDYDRRMRLKASGIDLEVLPAVVSAHLGLERAELSGPSRRRQISQARALISYLAVRELRISGADVARRMNIDRSSVSRAVRRVEADPALKNMRNALLDNLYPED